MPEDLKHYGVKGMKWGVRKDRAKSAYSDYKKKRSAPTEVETSQKPGQFVKSKGGRNQSASEDAVQAQRYRQIAKASTTDSLSNKELQALVNRMNLEQQYNNLASQSDRRSRGTKLVNSILGNKQAREQALGQLSDLNPGTATKINQVADVLANATAGPKGKKKK